MKVTLNYRDGRKYVADVPADPPSVVTFKARNDLRRTLILGKLSTEYHEATVHLIVSGRKMEQD